MKKSEIEVGKNYTAKVAGRLTTVRVDLIREFDGQARYDVTNLITLRRTTFRSAAKFRSVAVPLATTNVVEACGRVLAGEANVVVETTTVDEDGTEVAVPEDEYSSDPIGVAQSASIDATCAPTTSDSMTPAEKHISDEATNQPEFVGQHTTPMPASIASAFAAMPAAPTRKYPLTDEQQAIVDAAPNEQVLVLEAGAGCGKTSTLVELSNVMPGRGQYTAFNTSLVAESKSKFDAARCVANTIHSLAFRSEGARFKHRLGGRRVMAGEVAALLGVQPMTVKSADDKDKVLDGGLLTSQAARAVKMFCQSADREVGLQHFGNVAGLSFADQDAVKAYMLPHAQAMWSDMQDTSGRLPFFHDAYVKMFELNDPVISADYFMVDESQDLSGCMLSIARQQVKRGVQVILVGDGNQAIYGFRGCVNALAAFPDAKTLYLSTSFRFGPVIAEVANSILSNLQKRTKLVMRGFDKVASRLAPLSSPHAVLCRTNAAAVQTVLTAIKDGKRPHLVGGGDEVLKFVRAAQDLQGGRRTQHPELAAFESWGEVKAYAATDEGEDLKLMTKLVEAFGADKIAAALKNMPREDDADVVVSTCHKSKGREWDTVRLANDFKPLSKMDDEELRLLYVACTRARKVLDVEACAPFCGGSREREDGTMQRERCVDLTEARRLSKLVSASEPTNVVVNTCEDGSREVKQIAAPAKPDFDYRNGTTNTWTKSKRGDWLVRGKPGQSGVVEVVRRNGARSQERLGKVVWQDAEVALYEVVAKVGK